MSPPCGWEYLYRRIRAFAVIEHPPGIYVRGVSHLTCSDALMDRQLPVQQTVRRNGRRLVPFVTSDLNAVGNGIAALEGFDQRFPGRFLSHLASHCKGRGTLLPQDPPTPPRRCESQSGTMA